MNKPTDTEDKPTSQKAADEPVKASAKPKMFKLTINSGEDKGDKGDVFLAHNHKSVLIQRDQEVTVSEHFIECLKNSTIETALKGEDGVERTVKIPRFSYNLAPA